MAETMAETALSFLLFGSPVARRQADAGRGAGEVEIVWRLRRAFQVVAYLAMKPGRRAPKDELIDAVWPEAGAGAVSRNFHPTLSDARRSLAAGLGDPRSTLVLRQGVYVLAPEIECRSDVEDFRRFAASGRELLAAGDDEAAAAIWQRAWELYRGPFLAGHDLPWVASLRERLRGEYLEVLRRLGDLRAVRAELTGALDAYRTVLLEEPYEEHVHQRVMELYGRQGRRDLVQRQYVRLQEHLQELGVEPLEGTRELYHRLML